MLLLLLLLFVSEGGFLRHERLWGGQGILRLRWVGYYTNWAGRSRVLFYEYQIQHTFRGAIWKLYLGNISRKPSFSRKCISLPPFVVTVDTRVENDAKWAPQRRRRR
jgi:hypothetical protein